MDKHYFVNSVNVIDLIIYIFMWPGWKNINEDTFISFYRYALKNIHKVTLSLPGTSVQLNQYKLRLVGGEGARFFDMFGPFL